MTISRPGPITWKNHRGIDSLNHAVRVTVTAERIARDQWRISAVSKTGETVSLITKELIVGSSKLKDGSKLETIYGFDPIYPHRSISWVTLDRPIDLTMLPVTPANSSDI